MRQVKSPSRMRHEVQVCMLSPKLALAQDLRALDAEEDALRLMLRQAAMREDTNQQRAVSYGTDTHLVFSAGHAARSSCYMQRKPRCSHQKRRRLARGTHLVPSVSSTLSQRLLGPESSFTLIPHKLTP